jgi:hypothetical protein
MNGSRTPLPADVTGPFQVFVNGIEQAEGTDYELRAGELVFAQVLVPPERHSARTYARLMFWGRYDKRHSVDVIYTVGGTRRVASGLDVLPPAAGRRSQAIE